MKVLIAPLHVVIDPLYGSEPAWAYNIVRRITEKFGIRIDAVVGKSSINPTPSLRIFEVGYSKGGLFNRGLFYLRSYTVAKNLYEGCDLIHHMFPFGFKTGFNPLAVFGHLKGKPFIIGPIQYPQEYIDITDYEWVSGLRGLKARLAYVAELLAERLISKPLEILHEVTLREAETLVFDSRKTLDMYKKLYSDILKGKILAVIPPGVETEVFQYRPPSKKEYFEILTVGYLLKRKGIQYLIRAISTIVKEFKNVRLRIVGEGSYKESLMRLAKKLNLDRYVEFSGYIPRHELPNVYANCDVYVQPSLSDTFPSAIREAMSVGRPVVATDVGFIREGIIDGVTGFLVPKADSEALAEKILLLLGNEKLREKVGREAHEYAKRVFDWQNLVVKWYNLYLESLE